MRSSPTVTDIQYLDYRGTSRTSGFAESTIQPDSLLNVIKNATLIVSPPSPSRTESDAPAQRESPNH